MVRFGLRLFRPYDGRERHVSNTEKVAQHSIIRITGNEQETRKNNEAMDSVIKDTFIP
jgi:hypothetical protein